MGVNARLYAYALDAAVRKYQMWGATNKIFVALMTDSYTPNQAVDQTWNGTNGISANEITGATNYTTNGKALTFPGTYYYYDSTGTPGGTMKLKADSITWANLTTDTDIKYAVIYTQNNINNTGLTNPLIGWITFPTPISCAGEDFTIDWTDDYVISIALDTANPSAPYARMQGTFWLKAFSNEIDFNDGKWTLALVTNSWAPNQDSPSFSYIHGIIPTANSSPELAATGNYTRKVLANMSSNYTPPVSGYGGHWDFTAGNVVWSNLTSSADFYFAVLFYDTSVDTESAVVGYINLNGAQSATNQNVTIAWDSGVVFQVSLDTAADT